MQAVYAKKAPRKLEGGSGPHAVWATADVARPRLLAKCRGMQSAIHELPSHDLWRAFAWIGVALIAGLLAFAWASGERDLILAMAIFLAATLAVQLLVKQLPSMFAFLLVVVALVNGAGGSFGWFESFRWYDEGVHLYSGFAGMAAIGCLYARGRHLRCAAFVAWCTGMGLALAIGWEIIEGLMGDLEAIDTTTDVMLGTTGAALGGWFAWRVVVQPRLL
jgi:hypothetical protein